MTGNISFRISSAAAPYIGADKPRQERLKAAAGRVKLPAMDLLLLLFYLCSDADPEVKRTAVATLRGLPLPFLAKILANPDLHPGILDTLVKLHYQKTELVPLFLAHPMLSEKSAVFLAAQAAAAAPATPAAHAAAEPEPEEPPWPPPADQPEEPEEPDKADVPAAVPDDDTPVDETTEEFQSKYQLAQNMGVGEKIKTALTGDKEWRSILIKDSNKLVSGSVIRNPRITENEVLTIARSQVQNDEIIRVICANKDWLKNAQLRKALVENHKTPLQAALRLIPTLSEKDLSQLARSKNVSTVIATNARRVMFYKKEGK